MKSIRWIWMKWLILNAFLRFPTPHTLSELQSRSKQVRRCILRVGEKMHTKRFAIKICKVSDVHRIERCMNFYEYGGCKNHASSIESELMLMWVQYSAIFCNPLSIRIPLYVTAAALKCTHTLYLYLEGFGLPSFLPFFCLLFSSFCLLCYPSITLSLQFSIP